MYTCAINNVRKSNNEITIRQVEAENERYGPCTHAVMGTGWRG
jgi:hypothetical protein